MPRKLIYIPSEEMWESVKKAAAEDGRSASNYLIQLHRVKVDRDQETCGEVVKLFKEQ